MPGVVLIGDSIRMRYQEVVRRELEDVADIWAPEENGGNSQNVLDHLDAWALAKQPAIVHINCGLHDIKKDFDTHQPAIAVDDYAANVRQILSTLQQSRATVIWATTTPVNEAWHHANKGFDRFEDDLRAYNEVASGIAEELGIPINDLFSVIMEAGRDQYLTQDGVHFTEEGSSLLGKAAAKFVRGYLLGD